MSAVAPGFCGVLYGLPNEQYHQGVGLSHSGLKDMRRSPFHHHQLSRERSVPPKEPSPQMFNGTLVHCALLEPDQFDLRYAVPPPDKADKRTKAHKEWVDSLVGHEPITALQHEQAMRQADRLRSLPEVAQLLGRGDPEVSAYWNDQHTHVHCKCRPDWVSPVGMATNEVVLLDVKTAADASTDGFARSAANFGYHTQAQWYMHGYARAHRERGVQMRVHGVLFAVVENEYPHAAACFMFDDAALKQARLENEQTLRTYARCAANDEWPGYARGVQVISLPSYYRSALAA